jgi:hypothetical protein
MTPPFASILPEDESRPKELGSAKAQVLAEFTRLVHGGSVIMSRLEGGTLEMRLVTGETFHLGEETVTRVA